MFCECGTLICFPNFADQPIVCRRCSTEIKIDVKSAIFQTIRTEKIFSKVIEKKETSVIGAKIKIQCPGCGAEELSYNTAQLRSADEGQTVFYTCEKCGFKDTVQS